MKINIEIEVKDEELKNFLQSTMHEFGWAIFKKVSEK